MERANTVKTWLSWLTLGLFVAMAAVSSAEPGVAELREQGRAAYKAGDYARAKQVFDEAYRRAPLHSLGVWGARTRVKLGKWLEASERYERLVQTPIRAGDKSEEEEARRQAAREREELRHRIPRVRIRVAGIKAADTQVSIDGAPVAPEYLVGKGSEGPFRRGKSLELDPGEHHIVGTTAGGQHRELSFTLEEGQTRSVILSFANPDTIRQRKCRDKCRIDCKDDNSCYMECKRRCFTRSK